MCVFAGSEGWQLTGIYTFVHYTEIWFGFKRKKRPPRGLGSVLFEEEPAESCEENWIVDAGEKMGRGRGVMECREGLGGVLGYSRDCRQVGSGMGLVAACG